jgi:HK97 family phage major capsid protein
VAYIGDMTQTVLFCDRRAMTMRVSAERYLEYDQMAIMATERFDINVFNPGTSTLVGPLIQFSTHS